MRRVLQITLVFFAVLASGCITVGDSSFIVNGHLTMAEAQVAKCSLELSLVGQNPPQPRAYYVRAIGTDFSESFTIEPAVKKYKIAILCPGYESFEKEVESTRSVTRVELGDVALNRKG